MGSGGSVMQCSQVPPSCKKYTPKPYLGFRGTRGFETGMVNTEAACFETPCLDARQALHTASIPVLPTLVSIGTPGVISPNEPDRHVESLRLPQGCLHQNSRI